MKKFIFVIEFMGKEVYEGKWEAETLEKAQEEIDENLDLSILPEEEIK
jgi:hypothetical protein